MGIFKKNPAIILGLGITILFLGLSFSKIGFFEALELKFYDIRMSLKNISDTSDDIVIVDIDEDSIKNIGRWPWSRAVIAQCIDKINEVNPKVIGMNIMYNEPEESSALEQIKNFIELAEQSDQKDSSLLTVMKKTLEDLDNDKKLEESLDKAGNVIFPVSFYQSRIIDKNKTEEDKELIKRALTSQNLENSGLSGQILAKSNIDKPINDFLKSSNGIGHVNLVSDLDGTIRKNMLFFRYKQLYIPSFSLSLAAAYLNVPNSQVKIKSSSVELADVVTIPAEYGSDLLVSFKKSEIPFQSYSFNDVYKNKIPEDAFKSAFKNKLVIITPSAAGVDNAVSTPIAPQMSTGILTANTIWTILNSHFITKPHWDRYATIALIIVVGILISFVLPRMKAVLSGLIFIIVMAGLVGGSIYVFTANSLWIQITYPFLQLLFGYIGVVTINFFVAETGKEKVEGESAETNRMLGLSFQSQGMLDMAFDKFRKVPVDDETKDLLYNLALDYERKRQYNKAASVYEYIEEHDPDYKNVTEKKQKLNKASDTMVFGGDSLLGATAGADPLLSGDGDTKPTLGRYEIIKQLGKGAMGIVYLGQDPRINRTTAIKTFKFTEDFEPDEAQKLKEKFFREAESAGTLSHPNIVTIYDAGDEHDLAYIAMEFLDGEDFQKYTKKKTLLPVRKVIDYIADIADGLDYAHEKGIVHRDIKPANVMILKTGVVKITDFGIARITATSQTQTGVVKGTPHYMSPEQITGKKVDGRSDIFSLGAMLYQMVTGDLPFRGDSPAALMHQIMNVAHPDPRKRNPKLVKPLVAIIDKSLAKDRNKRYLKAGHMAKHLRALGMKIDAVIAQKKKAAN